MKPKDKIFEERKAIAKRTFRLIILNILNERKMNGYEIIKTMREMFEGEYSPSPGLVYPTLRALEKEGLVLVENIGGSKYYQPSDEGKRVLRERKKEIEEMIERIKELKSGKHGELKKAVERLLRTLYIYLPEISENREKEIVRILDNARNEVERILQGGKNG
ncbi:MAG: PadR family transcriptional regulator [Fervidicoccaceae archaeon]